MSEHPDVEHRALPPHQEHCLGCGTANPASLGATYALAGDRVVGHVRFDRRQEGAPGLAHGGALATLLDDALGSLLAVVGRPAVTARLCVDYRSPAVLHRDLVVDAWIERVDGRKLHLAGTVKDGEVVVAEATALFLEVDLSHFEAGGETVPPEWGSAWNPGGPSDRGRRAA